MNAMKAAWLAGIAGAGGIVLAALFAAGPAWAADAGIIQVRASGTVTAAPDTLELRLVVRQTAESLALASQRADEIVEEAVAAAESDLGADASITLLQRPPHFIPRVA